MYLWLLLLLFVLLSTFWKVLHIYAIDLFTAKYFGLKGSQLFFLLLGLSVSKTLLTCRILDQLLRHLLEEKDFWLIHVEFWAAWLELWQIDRSVKQSLESGLTEYWWGSFNNLYSICQRDIKSLVKLWFFSHSTWFN